MELYITIRKENRRELKATGLEALAEYTRMLQGKYIQEEKIVKTMKSEPYMNRQTIKFVGKAIIYEFANIPVLWGGSIDTHQLILDIENSLKGGE